MVKHPNLPGWDNIPIVAMVEKKTGIKTNLHNDANACALAEWKFGAGKGTKMCIRDSGACSRLLRTGPAPTRIVPMQLHLSLIHI